MGLWFISIRAPTAEVLVQADRRLVFQVLTAWGAASPDGRATSRVLKREGDRLYIEFHTPVRMLFGLKMVFRTLEWVTLEEPGLIDFETHKGAIPVLHCIWTLEEWGDCCRFKYDATFAAHGSVLGWVFGVLLLRPMMARMMREHLVELKGTIEARAARSRVFPQKPCPPEAAPGQVADKAVTA